MSSFQIARLLPLSAALLALLLTTSTAGAAESDPVTAAAVVRGETDIDRLDPAETGETAKPTGLETRWRPRCPLRFARLRGELPPPHPHPAVRPNRNRLTVTAGR